MPTRGFLFFRPRGRSSGPTEETYIQKVLSYSPGFFWPLNELTGTAAVNAVTPGTGNGTFSGVALDQIDGPAGENRGGLWGTGDYCNVYSAAVNTYFNGQACTIMIWGKVSAVGVWTDSTIRKFINFGVDGNNLINIGRLSSNNAIRWQYMAGGTNVQRDKVSLSTTDWFNAAFTISLADNRARAYWLGVQEGADLTSLGTWAGSLNSAQCTVGAANTSAQQPFSGYLMHAAVWNSELSAAAILDMATV